MDLGLKDRVALVTGSSRGIGRAIASVLAEEGAVVAVTGTGVEDLDRAVHELRVQFGDIRVEAFSGDMADASVLDRTVAALVEKYGRLNILVANVGFTKSALGWNISDEDWEQFFRLNLDGGFRAARRAIPEMLKCGGGAITFVSSIAGMEAFGAPIPYGASKYALLHLMKALARELADRGIRVNAVVPGNILFPGGNWDRKLSANREGIEAMIAREVPMKRFGTPEDVAHMVAFLCSERTSFVTGACVLVDGGQTRTVH